MKGSKRLIIVLGDQLSTDLTALSEIDPAQDIILMMEVMEEARYAPHHPQKIILIFSAMRHFSATLQQQGLTVEYIDLEHPKNQHTFEGNIAQAIQTHQPTSILVTEPSEYRVRQKLLDLQKRYPLTLLPDDRFFCSTEAFSQWATGKKTLRMEYFYRSMRKQHHILMNGGQPEGGTWNYDQQNRKPPDKTLTATTFKHLTFPHDDVTRTVIALVKTHFNHHFGNASTFNYAVTAEEAERALAHFIKHHLPSFGDYQDAMLSEEPILHHSLLSAYMNIGLLNPRRVVDAVLQAYKKNKAPLPAVEGYIRQIIGWREYVRGIYWHHMPQYQSRNTLNATRPLPSFYWHTNTPMRCMQSVLQQTEDLANSHHIQRLMVTGNFALLLGVDPQAISEWYLSVYVDAFEWVELPNTLGMSQFADDGVMASKPYAASGRYIDKMSNFCRQCHFNVKEKTGKKACPFNFLYWDFLLRNQSILQKNPRMTFPYRHVINMTEDTKQALSRQAAEFIQTLYEKETD